MSLVRLNFRNLTLFQDEEFDRTHMAVYVHARGPGIDEEIFRWNNAGGEVDQGHSYNLDNAGASTTILLDLTGPTLIWVEGYADDDQDWPSGSSNENSLGQASITIDPGDASGNRQLGPTTTDNDHTGYVVNLGIDVHPAPFSDYTVTVFTGDIDNAGTDADVSITIVGENGSHDLGPLNGDGDVFDRRSEDSFDFSVEDLGDLIQVRISHNNKDDDAWFLDRVEVATIDPLTSAERRWIFPCGEVLGTHEADHKTARVLFPSNGLTGFWRADDGGYYYLRKQLTELWWAGLSPDGLQNGLTYCNVFRGTITGQAVQGNWAELPRGITGAVAGVVGI